jgi:hypothetical protein
MPGSGDLVTRPYTEPPSCTRCGGRLVSDTERCACGGSSQYYLPGLRAAVIELERRREPPAGFDVHNLDPCPLCSDAA